MRLGATIDTASVGHIPVGSYTIVEEKYGKVSKSGEEGLWGRIKSEQPYNGNMFRSGSAFLIPRKCNRNEFCPGAEMLPDYLIECPNIENQEEEE